MLYTKTKIYILDLFFPDTNKNQKSRKITKNGE